MQNVKEEFPVLAALITMPPETPARITHLGMSLCDRNYFCLTILGYKPRSIFSLRFSDPLVSLSMTGFAAYQFIKYGHGKTQVHCREIFECPGNELSSDAMQDINYISGRLSIVAFILDSIFHLLVVPRHFRPPNIRPNVVARIDLGLVRARKIPILFCARPEKWYRVIIMKVDRLASCAETLLMGHLLGLLGETMIEENKSAGPTIAFNADTIASCSLSSLPHDTVDMSELPSEEQKQSVLVISSKVACSVLGASRLRKKVQDWQGGVLVIPSYKMQLKLRSRQSYACSAGSR